MNLTNQLIVKNNLKQMNPILANEWHPTKNKDLKPEHIGHKSGRRVWWQCQEGHEWEAQISNRSNGTRCPYCTGKRPIVGVNDLATTHPHLINEWHPTKNGEKQPEHFTKSSNHKIWWQCEKGHEWEAMITNRNKGAGCPYCKGLYPISGETDLATTHPHLVKEWHPTKNLPLTPQTCKYGSAKKVWWQCEKGHIWKASLLSRSHGSDCPTCSLIKTRSFEEGNPHLVHEWHPTKNLPLKPSDIAQYSNQPIWWLGECGHEWSDLPLRRTKGKGCPHCKSEPLKKEA